MKKLVVDETFWHLFPNAQINLLTLYGIDNHYVNEQAYFQNLLTDAAKSAKTFITEATFRENPVVDQWRQAYRQFKTKKGARSSIEALLKRVAQGKTFSPILPLVDLYNSVSLKYGVPAGGEDLSAVKGDLHLGTAKGGESFFPHGAKESLPALPGEVIYYDNRGAVCRCFNWREAQRTELKETTTDAVLVIESVNLQQAQRADEAISALAALCADYFNVVGRQQKLNQNNQTVSIDKETV